MLKKLSSVLILALALGGQHFLVSSAVAQDATAPATEAAPAADATAPATETAPAADAAAPAADADAASVIDAANDSSAGKEQPHGLEKAWADGDAVTRSVLVLMVIMSAATW